MEDRGEEKEEEDVGESQLLIRGRQDQSEQSAAGLIYPTLWQFWQCVATTSTSTDAGNEIHLISEISHWIEKCNGW